MTIFDINNYAFEILGYPISYVELIGTLFGLISVYLASRAHIMTWPTGIINEVFFFILFFQVQLYADMVLQVYFFATTLYGWYFWKQKKQPATISTLSNKHKISLAVLIILGSALSGMLFANIHLYLPNYFPIPAAFPFVDSFVMVLSIVANFLLAKKKIESWYLWILVDVICVYLFFKKGVVFLGLEYLLFLFIAAYGLINWKKQMHHD